MESPHHSPLAEDSQPVTLRGKDRQLAEARQLASAAERAKDLAQQEAAVMFRASQSLLLSADPEDTCRRLIFHLSELMPVERSLIYVVDHDLRRIILAAENGAPIDFLYATYADLEDSLLGQVHRSGNSLRASQAGVVVEPLGALRIESADENKPAAVLIVPLAVHERVIGTLTLVNPLEHPFDDHATELILALATQAAASIENARLLNAESERRRIARVLVQAGRRVSSSLRLDEVPGQVLEQLGMVVPYERASLILRDGTALRIVAQRGFPDDERMKDLRITLREGDVFDQVAKSSYPIIVDDVNQTPGWKQVEWLPLNLSWMGAPLYSVNRVIGMLSLTRREASAFSQDDALLVSTFALQAAVALENAALYDEITRFNEHLEETVRRRTEEVQRAYQLLEKLDRHKSDFINVVAHELRTPLTVMLGYLGMMRANNLVAQDAYLSKLLEGVLNGSNRMHDVVNTMLDVARIDSQTLKLQVGVLAIAPIFKRIQSELEMDLRQRKMDFVVQDLDEMPLIQGDVDLLLKVFYHLTINAVKYTPDGGRIIISGERVNDPQAGDSVEIQIQDSGIGIDAEFQEVIFQKFYQTGTVALHSSGRTKFKGGGPGLGLAIARGIVQAHHGRIWVESPGHDEENFPGSTFHVLLPISPKK